MVVLAGVSVIVFALVHLVPGDPVRLALVHTYRRFGIPVEHLVDFLAAMTSDLDVDSYADMAALDRYMWGSASVIGLQVLPVLGTAPGVTREEAAPHAIALGEAFQLTNFLREVVRALPTSIPHIGRARPAAR